MPIDLEKFKKNVDASLKRNRAAFEGKYAEQLDELLGLRAGDLARAGANGLLFDASAITTLLFAPILALLVPFRWARGRAWRDVWAWIAFALWCAAALILASDVCYFGVVHRHIGPELSALLEDGDLMTGIVSGAYAAPLVATLALLALAGFGWARLMRWDARAVERPSFAHPPGLVAWPMGLLAPPMLLVALRGNVSGKTLGIVDAFESGSLPAGFLALNGPFSIAHTVLLSEALAVDFMPWPDAVASVRAQILAPGERALGAGAMH